LLKLLEQRFCLFGSPGSPQTGNLLF